MLINGLERSILLMDFISKKISLILPLIVVVVAIGLFALNMVRNTTDNTAVKPANKTETIKPAEEQSRTQEAADADSQPAQQQTAVVSPAAPKAPAASAAKPDEFNSLIEELKSQLEGKNPKIIREIAKQIAKLGEGAIPQIQKMLSDKEVGLKMKLELVKILGEIGGEKAIYALLEEMAKNPHPTIQFMASKSIYHAAGGDIDPFLKKEMLKKDNYTVIASLLKTVQEVKDPEILTNLNLLMANESASMEARASAARFLGQDGLRFLEEKMGESSQEEYYDDMLKSITSMETPEALDTLLRLTTANVSEDTRREIYSAISEMITNLTDDEKLNSESLARIEGELSQNLINADGAGVEHISDALSSINLDSARSVLREEIDRRTDASQRLALASALVENYSSSDMEMSPENNDYLLDMAKEYSSIRYEEEIRIRAINLIRTIGGDQGTEFLQTLTNDSNLRIRSLADKLIKN